MRVLVVSTVVRLVRVLGLGIGADCLEVRRRLEVGDAATGELKGVEVAAKRQARVGRVQTVDGDDGRVVRVRVVKVRVDEVFGLDVGRAGGIHG